MMLENMVEVQIRCSLCCDRGIGRAEVYHLGESVYANEDGVVSL